MNLIQPERRLRQNDTFVFFFFVVDYFCSIRSFLYVLLLRFSAFLNSCELYRGLRVRCDAYHAKCYLWWCSTHVTLRPNVSWVKAPRPVLYPDSLLKHYVPSRSLRSSDSSLLSVPRVRTCFGSRSFAVAAPTIWNTLALDIHNSPSMCCFHRRLKTFLYNLVCRPPS